MAAPLKVEPLRSKKFALERGHLQRGLQRGLVIAKNNARERFSDVQRARLSVQSHAIPIKNTVGRIAVLLHFRNQTTRSDRVAAPHRNVN